MAQLQAATSSVHQKLHGASFLQTLDARSGWVRLQIVVEELSRAAPARKAEHEKLLGASADLLTSRRKHLSGEQLKRLDEDLEWASGVESMARLEQLASLRSWLSGSPRFPPAWIEAVEATVGDAGEVAGETIEPRCGATGSMVRSTGPDAAFANPDETARACFLERPPAVRPVPRTEGNERAR